MRSRIIRTESVLVRDIRYSYTAYVYGLRARSRTFLSIPFSTFLDVLESSREKADARRQYQAYSLIPCSLVSLEVDLQKQKDDFNRRSNRLDDLEPLIGQVSAVESWRF